MFVLPTVLSEGTYLVKNAVLDEENAFRHKVFLCKQELIFTDIRHHQVQEKSDTRDQYCFIEYPIHEVSTVLCKRKLFPHERLLFPDKSLQFATLQLLPLELYCVLLIQ